MSLGTPTPAISPSRPRRRRAAALCGDQIYGRVVYLESLGEGALATVPPEAAVGECGGGVHGGSGR